MILRLTHAILNVSCIAIVVAAIPCSNTNIRQFDMLNVTQYLEVFGTFGSHHNQRPWLISHRPALEKPQELLIWQLPAPHGFSAVADVTPNTPMTSDCEYDRNP